MIGKKLAHYEILDLLGRGGMGEVYRARDTKLDREVALKVLPREMSGDAERIARFQREARTLASLQHENVASIYDFEDTSEARFLVMELAEGEDLSARIRRGALPALDAIEIAKQIAAGLEAAHEQNIVHRDLKPANVKLGVDGKVKILDFGLARAYAGEEVGEQDPAMSPTITAAMTQAGTILGTAAYMSPEQARGKAVDKRADIWAFGCVFYEMLTGNAPFGGDNVTDVIADVVKTEPDWDALPDALPPRVRVLLWRCLQKDPRRRLRDIGEAIFELSEQSTDPSGSFGMLGSTLEPAPRRWPLLLVSAAAGILLGALSMSLLGPGEPKQAAEPTMDTFYIVPPSDQPYVRSLWDDVAISPDGRSIVYTTNSGGNARFSGGELLLSRRDLSSLTVGPISEEIGGISPFFSPDGKYVAFIDYGSGRLMKLPLNGGQATMVCDSLPSINGGSWTSDGWIFCAEGSGSLLQIPAAGGDPVLLAEADPQKNELGFLDPYPLADGQTLLVGIRSSESAEGGGIFAFDLESRVRKLVTPGLRPIHLTPGGNLVYLRENSIVAQRFDDARHEVSGHAVTLLEGVGEDIAISRTGTLVYAEGTSGDRRQGKFIWVERDGTVRPFSEGALTYPRYPRFSRDGTKLVHTSGPAGNGQLWVLDLVRSTPPVNLTFENHNVMALFDPSGTKLVFKQAQQLGDAWLGIIAADGSELAPAILPNTPSDPDPAAWLSDGTLIFNGGGGQRTAAEDIFRYLLPDSTSAPLIQTQFDEGYCSLSPDERWLAYESDRSGRKEIWVQRYPSGAPRRVSLDGGSDPVWAPDGSELYYQEGSALMAAAVTPSGDDIELGRPVELFRDVFVPAENFTPRSYDAHPDGRFLMVAYVETEEFAPNFIVIQNWVAQLDRRVAAANAGGGEE